MRIIRFDGDITKNEGINVCEHVVILGATELVDEDAHEYSSYFTVFCKACNKKYEFKELEN